MTVLVLLNWPSWTTYSQELKIRILEILSNVVFRSRNTAPHVVREHFFARFLKKYIKIS